MEIGIVGYGQMGRELEKVIQASNHQVKQIWQQFPDSETTKVACLIDFSNPNNLTNMIAYAKDYQVPLVIATTGYTDNQLAEISAVAKDVPILFSANYSLGVIVMNQVVKQLGSILGASFDIEVIEKHHRKKLDSPSGTAKMLLDSLLTIDDYQVVSGREGSQLRQKKEIGVHAVRGGTIVGEHEVIFAGEDEVLSIKHEAFSKEIFARGALVGAEWLVQQAPGLYTMEDCLF